MARWAGLALVLASCGSAPPVQQQSSRQLATRRIARPPVPRKQVVHSPSPQTSVAPTGSTTPALPPEPPTLRVYFVDVGQGDATIVVGPGDGQEPRVLVIDAGPLDRPDGGAVVRQLMQTERIERIDYAILTHFDADHLGGFVTAQGSTSLFWGKDCAATALFPRIAVYEHSTDTFDTQAAREWDRCIRPVARRVRVSKSTGLGDTLQLGAGYTARIIAGDGYVLGREQRVAKVSSENSRSVVTLIQGPGGFDLLVPGDATGQRSGAERAEVEVAIGEYLVANGIDIEVLRVGHHGADNTSNPAFIEAARPEVAIISVGDKQPPNFKHPRCKTYTTLAAMNVRYVVQTEAGRPDCTRPEPMPLVVNGSIRMDVSGASYQITQLDPLVASNTDPIHLVCGLTGCSAAPTADASRTCCRYCSSGQPCGDTCIAKDAICNTLPGCACAVR